jgi:hypothetical protein
VSLRNATTSISTLSKNILCSIWEHNSSFFKKLVELAGIPVCRHAEKPTTFPI